MKIRHWVMIFGLAVLITACMIFLFSSEEGSTSASTSGRVVTLLLRLFRPDYEYMYPWDQVTLFSIYQREVRKVAHFFEFAALGTFLHCLFFSLHIRRKMSLAWLAGTLYACTDELHQMFVAERTASWQDVCIDSAGVLFGVLLALLILYLRRRKQMKESETPPTEP